MFGIKYKVYNCCAIISLICGIVLLSLKLFNVIKDPDSLATLVSIIFILLSVALVLNPISKRMKKITGFNQEYRTQLYTLITKDCSKNKIDVTNLDFYETEKNLLKFVTKKSKEELVFSNLSFDEALYITKHLLKEFVKIVYGVGDNSKKLKSKVEKFSVNIHMQNNTTTTYFLIENYEFIKL